eukprot:Rmarinus@m.24770
MEKQEIDRDTDMDLIVGGHRAVDMDASTYFLQYVRTCLGNAVNLSMVCCPFFNLRVIREGSVGVLTRFAQYSKTLASGAYVVNPCTEDIMEVSLRTVAVDVPEQSVMTKDNLTIHINAVVFYQVLDPRRALFAVQDFQMAISNLAQSTLRTVIGEHSLQDAFQDRQSINDRLQSMLDRDTDAWGIKVHHVEIKDVVLPDDMQRAMAAVAEASREAKARVILAEANKKAATVLAEAAGIMQQNPVTLQLEYFDTLTAIASEQNQTIIVPDSLSHVMGQAMHHPAAAAAATTATSRVFSS